MVFRVTPIPVQDTVAGLKCYGIGFLDTVLERYCEWLERDSES